MASSRNHSQQSKLSPAEQRGLDARLAAIRSMPAPIPASERYQHTIETVEQGGFFKLDGLTYLVQGLHAYREGEGPSAWEWWELELLCLQNGETTFMEWEKDDKVEASMTLKKLSWKDLRDDKGGKVDEDDLEEMVEEEDDLVYEKTTFEYEDDSQAMFFRNDDGEGEPVWIVDFEAKDGTTLTIEEWGDEASGDWEYDISLSRQIDPDTIEVLVEKSGSASEAALN